MMKSQKYLMRDKESNQSIKQNEALRSRMVADRYILESPEQAPERREAPKKKTENKSSNL